MFRRYLFIVCALYFYLAASSLQAQRVTISGYIEDAATGEKLIGASVYDALSNQGMNTNNYGFYSLTLPAGRIQLSASYVGYEDLMLELQVERDTLINLRLGASGILQEVEVTAVRATRAEDETQMSRVSIPIETIKKLPSLMGEVDVLKALQLLPGVQSGGEGQNGLYVRGGSPDQNLILLDGVPVYNVSHLLGFFSVFNADAINTVTLTKGGFPARYGGRLSSVIDIVMKEGNNQQFKGTGSIGLISSKVTLEGPIQKDQSSFIVSARRTYLDILMRPLIKAASPEGSSVTPILYFYDLNAKVNHKFNERHRIYLSAYMGSDKFGAKSKTEFGQGDYSEYDAATQWGNLTTALRWNNMISPQFFCNTTATYSQYRFRFESGFTDKIDQQKETFLGKYFSSIKDVALRTDFDYVPLPAHYIRFGASAIHHTYDPGAFNLKFSDAGNNQDTIIGSKQSRSVEYSAYVEDDVSRGNFSANFGIHYSGFAVSGGQSAFYHSLQPRLSLRYLLKGDVALKASYANMAQYINLLTNEGLSLPTDLWVPSTARVKPQRSNQVAIGAVKTLGKEYEVSVEAFYKKMHNVLSYREGASFLGVDQDWQNKVTQGDGEAYGFEFFVQKKTGRFSGWVGYTLAWNFRQFDDINSGRRYPFKYDRRHDISVVGTYELSKKIVLSGAFVYGTGNAITLPVSRFTIIEDWQSGWATGVESPNNKNNFRMGDYHRLDLSVEVHKKTKWGESWWAFSVYNAYNRRNPYFIYNGYNIRGERSFRQVSLFPVVPSVSYNFKF